MAPQSLPSPATGALSLPRVPSIPGVWVFGPCPLLCRQSLAQSTCSGSPGGWGDGGMCEQVCGDISRMVATECYLSVGISYSSLALLEGLFFWSLGFILKAVSLRIVLVTEWFRCAPSFWGWGKDSKSPTYEPSSCKPSKMQTCIHQRQVWVKLQFALHLLLLTILQLHHLPPPLSPPVRSSSCLFTWCQPLYTSCCTALLYFSRCYTVRLKMFSCYVFYVLFVWKVL